MVEKIPTPVIALTLLIIAAAAMLAIASADRPTTMVTERPVVRPTTVPAYLSPFGALSEGSTLWPASPHSPVTTEIPRASPPVRLQNGTVRSACILAPFRSPAGSGAEGFTYHNTMVFTSVSAGNYSRPFAGNDPGITREQALGIVMKEFSRYLRGTAAAEYTDGSHGVRTWTFSLFNGTDQFGRGTVDADTGDLIAYSVSPRLADRLGNESLQGVTQESARKTAWDEIHTRNGDFPAQLLDEQMNPDGTRIFVYKRWINGIPCSRDGFSVTIDPRGNVVQYTRTWYTPENAVADTKNVSAVTRDQAIALVEREAGACYPDSADSLAIVSADLRWMDMYDQEKYVPDPGVIPLAWYVRFDDQTIRTSTVPVPEEAWVDAHNGTLLAMTYFHHP